MPEGLIIKALSGYYYVLPGGEAGAEPIQCRARGIFKKMGLSPLVGDRVVYSLAGGGDGTVESVAPRDTELVRPPIANADTALLVFAVCEPELSEMLLDKFLAHTEKAGLQSILCLTKVDLLGKANASLRERVARVRDIYSAIGYPVFVCSSKTGEGMDEVLQALEGRITVFSGQSGAGKSSLLNRLIPGLQLATGAISDRLGRGKHTTRHVELIAHPNAGWIGDTPGFSQLDFAEIEAGELGHCFVEISELAAGCKFRGCLHRAEPDCAVQEAVRTGAVSQSRYDHYLVFLEEIRERKRRYSR